MNPRGQTSGLFRVGLSAPFDSVPLNHSSKPVEFIGQLYFRCMQFMLACNKQPQGYPKWEISIMKLTLDILELQMKRKKKTLRFY